MNVMTSVKQSAEMLTFDWRKEDRRDDAVRKALSKMSMSAKVSQTCFSRSLMIVCTQLHYGTWK